MIEAFGAYIKTITALTIFSALAGMLMPDGNFRKYVELVLGVLVLTAVLSPFLKLFGTDSVDFERNIVKGQLRLEENLWSEEAYQQTQRRQLEEAYGYELEKRIQEDLEKKFAGITEVTVTFCTDFADDSYGALESLTIGCKEKDTEEIRKFTAKRYELEEDAVSVLN